MPPFVLAVNNFFQSAKILFGEVVSSCMQFFKNERGLCSLSATLSTFFCRFGDFFLAAPKLIPFPCREKRR